MSKSNPAAIAKSVKAAMLKHSPEILTGFGIAGMITSTILAVRATPKALILLDKKKNEEEIDTLSQIETIKTVWTCYIPSAITGVISVTCLIGASSVNARRNAALAAAYTLSESALKDYQEKVIETIGEQKEQVVRDAVAKEKLERTPVSNSEVIITGKGDSLCYDAVSGRYFHSDIEKLKKAENNLNRRMRDEMYITLNEFYCEIGLDPIGIGDDIGWNIDKGYIELEFSAQLADDGTPCMVIEYHVAPYYGFYEI